MLQQAVSQRVQIAGFTRPLPMPLSNVMIHPRSSLESPIAADILCCRPQGIEIRERGPRVRERPSRLPPRFTCRNEVWNSFSKRHNLPAPQPASGLLQSVELLAVAALEMSVSVEI